QVHDGGLVLELVEMSNGPTSHRVRKEPKIAAARHGQAAPEEEDGGHGELRDAGPVHHRYAMRESGSVGDAVAVVDNGEDGRVVGEGRFPKHLGGPGWLLGDREGGGSESHHGGTRGVLDRGLGALDILGKIQTSLAMDHLMPVAVASYLVPARSDVLHQR